MRDRKSTRLNSSHANISYAVFCLKKKNATPNTDTYQIEVRRGTNLHENDDLVFAATTTSPAHAFNESGGKPRSNYHWRVRSDATWNQWQPWTEWRPFTL